MKVYQVTTLSNLNLKECFNVSIAMTTIVLRNMLIDIHNMLILLDFFSVQYHRNFIQIILGPIDGK